MVAVGHDVNYEGFLLAWAVVEGESANYWRLLLNHLIIAIPEVNSSDTTVISDRNNELMAVDGRIPLTNRVWCCWHRAQNVR